MKAIELLYKLVSELLKSCSGLAKMADTVNGEVCEESTLAENMERVKEEELEADMILIGDEGKECTYKEGYMKRQAVFSCLTCTPNGDAGFCTGCSLACHDGHDVMELWTRRHFRCDCGNSKFGQSICKLQADKENVNAENTYNQNYKGLYCTCHRGYPTPEGEVFGEMLQCCICEDWFHELHLGLPSSLQTPRDDDEEPTFDEFICKSCAPLCSFLSKYPGVVIAPSVVPDDSTGLVKDDEPAGVENGAQENGIASVDQGGCAECELCLETQEDCVPKQENGSVVNNVNISREVFHNPTAIIQLRQPMFLVKSWRSQLCCCPRCLKMYMERGLGYLLDSDDTLQAYDNSGTQKREESRAEDDEEDFLNRLDHLQQIEILHELNNMSSVLDAFLAPFSASGRAVTSADIHDFYETLKRKKRRLD